MYKNAIILIFIFFIFSSQIFSNENYNLKEESEIYSPIADVELNTKNGQIKMSDLYSQTPLMMALVFTRCAGICSPFLDNLSNNIKKIDSKENFKMLVVSFDPEDDVDRMQKMASGYELENDDKWIFATTNQISELNNSVGFRPIWDSVRKQFDHDALLVGINENGYIAKKLIGLRDSKDILAMIEEINNHFILSYPLPRENMLFTCFTYNQSTGEKKPSFGLIILLLPAIITSFLIIWFSMKKQENN